uniref:CSD domain-containing protein n=1 Tax=Eutreptiella gymnastica TaxID=73025 RepID=A0A7S4LPZ9_9EUGL|mmetsp:Transcript_84649/g.141574  ORF Transcript_84649/g.141574 Transcript_84649/m.141574 type:complete len:214 (+) Transcript_84649:39-680(+)
MPVTGVVKFFNKQKGFGFIVPDTWPYCHEEKVDLYCHFTDIADKAGISFAEGSTTGFMRYLSDGEHVEFDLVYNSRKEKYCALHVKGANGALLDCEKENLPGAEQFREYREFLAQKKAGKGKGRGKGEGKGKGKGEGKGKGKGEGKGKVKGEGDEELFLAVQAVLQPIRSWVIVRGDSQAHEDYNENVKPVLFLSTDCTPRKRSGAHYVSSWS